MPAQPEHSAVTELLEEWSGGNGEAFNELIELVYDDLSRIARRHLRDERDGHTLNTQALVHESYVRLVGKPGSQWRDRAQFFAVASTAMRRILIDYARRHRAEKRGGQQSHVSLGADAGARDRDLDELLTLEAGLRRLEDLDPRLVQIVECRFFGGLTVPETAEALRLSERTVAREWARARTHLYRHLRPEVEADGPR